MLSNEKLHQATIPRLNKYIPHIPSTRQAAFYQLDVLDAFYGGAAGGGKSDALLMSALKYAEVPGYNAILFRKTYADLALPEALMDRAAEWLSNTDAHWSSYTKTWHFPSGASLTFGYLEHEQQKMRYKSAAFQFIGFDELTEFTETSFRFLFSRLRKLEGKGIPLRMRSASNPGSTGHEWVKRRYVENKSSTRIFIPAKLEDNPHLDQESYRTSLNELDVVTRSQYLDGNWDIANAGNKFKREWFEVVSVVPEDCNQFVRYWDRAATEAKAGQESDWTVGVLLGRDKDKFCYVMDVKRVKGTPLTIDKLILQQAAIDGVQTAIYEEQEPGASGILAVNHSRELLAGYNYHADKKTVGKEVRANPVSSYAEAKKIKLVRGKWVNDFLDELEAFPLGDMTTRWTLSVERLRSCFLGKVQVYLGIIRRS